MSSELLCTLKHCRLAGYCLPSVKKYCEDHGFDWRRFKKGVPCSELTSYGLLEFNKVAEMARCWQGRENSVSFRKEVRLARNCNG